MKEPHVVLGQISVAELVADPYPQDTTAEAVVLYDFADVRIQLKGNELCVVTKYQVRTKIRRKSAYDRATITRALHKGGVGKRNEIIHDLEGYTYNLVGGAIVKSELDKSSVFTEKMSDQITLQKFILPNVREGSVIEYTYTLITPFAIDYNPDTWTFQQHVPVLWSEIKAFIPNYCHYKIITSGSLPLAISEHEPVANNPLPGGIIEGAEQYRFVVKDAPAFQPEAYITTESDYVAKVYFDLASYSFPYSGQHNMSMDWDDLDVNLVQSPIFGGQYKEVTFLREAANLIKRQHTDSLSRIEAAHSLVSRTMKWNGNNGLVAYDLKQVWETHKGDAGDINLLLTGLLRELGFDANPVILSTRAHGRVNKEFALVSKFDYVVAHVELNGKDLLCDATDPYLKPGMLPRKCLNGTGRLIHFTKGRFISLLPTERDAEVLTATFTMNEEGEVKGTLNQSFTGYKALEHRTTFLREGRTKYLDAVQKEKTTWQIERTTFANADSINMPFNVNYKLIIPEAGQLAGERLYLRPLLTEGHINNLFKDPKRRYPVDFGTPIDETYMATFILPKDVQIEELPKSLVTALPNNGGRFTYQITVVNNQVSVVSRVSIRKPVYFIEEYPYLREFYDKILAKHAEPIVMKLITTANK